MEIIDDTEHWLDRAREARHIASLLDGERRQRFLEIADEYEVLAAQTLKRLSNRKKAREE